MKVGRMIADLDGKETLEAHHISEAMFYVMVDHLRDILRERHVDLRSRNQLLKRRGFNAAREIAQKVHDEIVRKAAADHVALGADHVEVGRGAEVDDDDGRGGGSLIFEELVGGDAIDEAVCAALLSSSS